MKRNTMNTEVEEIKQTPCKNPIRLIITLKLVASSTLITRTSKSAPRHDVVGENHLRKSRETTEKRRDIVC